jgi:hypothetical protein
LLKAPSQAPGAAAMLIANSPASSRPCAQPQESC